MDVCTGACIFGACPNKVCVRYNHTRSKASKINVESRILGSVFSGDIQTDKSGYGIAVDIGTTTIVLYLYNLANAECLSVKTALNPQISLGVDVISRISFCDTTAGLDALHNAVVGALNNLASCACNDAGINLSDISSCVVTGNTTMLHLLEGLSPVTMGYLPFTPVSCFGYYVESEKIGLDISCSVYLVPCMSAFIGGDITSAVLASGMCCENEISVLLDLGTNGEMAIGNKSGIYTTSTAAGPAFEGAQIEKGMAGVKGAVSAVYPFDGEIKFDVIGDTEPRGICGSGILDMAALFVKTGCIDAGGYINDSEKYVKSDGDNNMIFLDKNVYLTQRDVRELQMAKATIAGGLKTLIHESGFDYDDIENVYIAGGFGNYMHQDAALDTGLIDRRFAGRIKCIGNGAGIGAVMALLSGKYIIEGERIAGLSRHVELGGNAYFMDSYVENMMFPEVP